MTKIIAEIGWNHMGDMNLAKQMIYEAKESGADIVKTQTFDVRRLKEGPWDTDGRREIYEKAQLNLEQHIKLRDYCNEIKIQFISSVFSIGDAKLLQKVETDMVKIPSMESRNVKLINYCTDNFDKIIISTGTSTLDELSSSVGFSDHTQGIEASVLALSYDIEFIEKHFTTDNDLPGRDNKFAILPNELKKLREYIDIYTKVNLDYGSNYQKCEEETREIYSGRWDGLE
jgi:sialic acid synthase SpsE